jgi:hypothetical protein
MASIVQTNCTPTPGGSPAGSRRAGGCFLASLVAGQRPGRERDPALAAADFPRPLDVGCAGRIYGSTSNGKSRKKPCLWNRIHRPIDRVANPPGDRDRSRSRCRAGRIRAGRSDPRRADADRPASLRAGIAVGEIAIEPTGGALVEPASTVDPTRSPDRQTRASAQRVVATATAG